MQKVSSSPSKAAKSARGMVAGVVKVVAANYVIDEFRNKAGDVALVFTAMKFDYVKSDEHGNVEDEDNVMHQHFIIQIAKDRDIENLKLIPGNMKSATDTEAEQCDLEVGASGNTYGGSAKVFANADWIEFCASLETKQWKPSINDESYAPNYVGMVFKFHSENKPLRKNQKSDDTPDTKWIVDDIYVRPYEAKSKETTKNAKSVGSTAGSTSASQTSSPNAANLTNGEATGEAFRAALTKLIESPAKGTQAVNTAMKDGGAKLNDFYRAVVQESSLAKLNGKGIPGPQQRDIANCIKGFDENEGGWIELHSEGLVMVDRDEGVVTVV